MNATQEKFYFANLGADIARCISALHNNNIDRYNQTFHHAQQTLKKLSVNKNSSAYKEGVLLLEGFNLAREKDMLPLFNKRLNVLIAQVSSVA